MPDTKKLDLRLLECLEALVAECHVTRAAENLDMSQPGMSNALSKLRKVFRDEILVRTDQGMFATRRGETLASQATEILAIVEAMQAPQGEFDPKTEKARFTVAASDYASLLLMPPLMKRLQTRAPNFEIDIREADISKLKGLLEDGSVDMAIGIWSDLASNLYVTSLTNERLVCIARKHHPDIVGELSLEQFARSQHVYFGASTGLVSTIETLVEQSLALRGLQRRVTLRTPDLNNVPAFVSSTDMIATVPNSLAASASRTLQLQVLAHPLRLEDFNVSLVWHPRKHHNPVHAWLRGEIKAAVDRLNRAREIQD